MDYGIIDLGASAALLTVFHYDNKKLEIIFKKKYLWVCYIMLKTLF